MAHMPTAELPFPSLAPGTDITEALRDLIDSATAAGGTASEVRLPSGTFYVSDTITAHQVRGLSLRGAGSMGIGTDLEWRGDRTRPMFVANRTQGLRVSDLSITATSTYPLLEGIRIQQGAIDNTGKAWPNLTSSLFTARDLVFRGQGQLGTAIRVYLYDAANDDKNDHHRFERLQITGCTHAAMVLEGRNAKALRLEQIVTASTIGGVELCDYGVLSVANLCPLTLNADGTPGALGDPAVNGGLPLYNHGASFVIVGGALQGNVVANVYVGDRNDALLIEGVYSEKSGRWLVVPDYGQGSSGAFPVVLKALRYSVNANTPADGEIIQVYADGPLSIEGCRFGQRIVGEQLRIRYAPPVQPGTFAFVGNAISNDGDGNVFVGETPGNDYLRVNRGYRDGVLGQLGAGVVIPTDGPSAWPYPATPAQWQVLGAPAPASQWSTSVAATPAWVGATAYTVGQYVTNVGNVYLAIEDGTSAASGGPQTTAEDITDGTVHWRYLAAGTGAVSDIAGAYPAIATGALEYQQAVAGYTRTAIHLAEAGENLSPNVTDYNPATTSVAWLVDLASIASTGNRVVVAMGNGSQAVGGGALQVKIQATGVAHLFIDGAIRATGVTNYETGGTPHRFLAVYDRQAAIAYLFTDTEYISASTAGLAITNNASKCVGANNGLAPDCHVIDPVVWEGQEAIDLLLTSTVRAALGVDATVL